MVGIDWRSEVVAASPEAVWAFEQFDRVFEMILFDCCCLIGVNRSDRDSRTKGTLRPIRNADESAREWLLLSLVASELGGQRSMTPPGVVGSAYGWKVR